MIFLKKFRISEIFWILEINEIFENFEIFFEIFGGLIFVEHFVVILLIFKIFETLANIGHIFC